MPQSSHSARDVLANLYFEAKRLYYQWRYPNVTIAKGVKIKEGLMVGPDVKLVIGEGSRLRMRVSICGSGEVIIGRNVLLNGCWIGCQRSITIGDDCLISDCFIVDTDYHNLEPHLRHSPPGPKVAAPIVIERNVWIGARATVMKGVNIGENTVVGLGCIVRKSLPPNVIAIGNPQQIVKHFDPQQRASSVNAAELHEVAVLPSPLAEGVS